MGISMLEDNDLGALSNSRLGGNKCFIDDSNYSNFSIVNKKKRNAKAVQSITQQYDLAAIYKGGCDEVENALVRVNAEIDADRAKNYSASLQSRYIAPKEDIKAKLLTIRSELKCVVKKETAEKESEQKETLNILTSAATVTPPFIPEDVTDKKDEEEDKASNTNKYIIYGVGGAILLISIILLIKPSR